jgi:hypothetical protein
MARLRSNLIIRSTLFPSNSNPQTERSRVEYLVIFGSTLYKDLMRKN